MSNLYLYERKQRRSAVTLLINMAVLFAMYLAARRFLAPGEATDQLFYWINIALPLVELGLFAVAVKFWLQNETFKVAVDGERFEIADPLSKSSSFNVPVSDIIKISQTHQTHVDISTIVMHMKSGDKIQITKNYGYNRRKLYDALAKANPDIELPKNAYRFTQS